MKLYGKEPQQVAIMCLIHDSNGGLGLVNDGIVLLERRLKELGINDSAIFTRIEYVKTGKKRIKESLDYYYEQLQNDFK